MPPNDPGRFEGIMPAIASPCDERDVFQQDTFTDLADWLYQEGVNGLYVCGGTGDGYCLRLDERKRILKIAIDVSKQYDGTVISHIGARTSRDAMDLAEHAAGAGAHGVSSMPPTQLSFAQLVEYYTDIARASELPVLVYHIPFITGVDLTRHQVVQLLDIEGVIGLKASDWNLVFTKQILEDRPHIVLFNGMDEFLVPGLLYGATGGIGMWYNVFPRLFIAMNQAVQNGNLATAMDLENRLIGLTQYGWEFGMKGLFERIMRQRDLAQYVFRRPRQTFCDATTNRLDQVVPVKLAAIDHALETLPTQIGPSVATSL